MRQARREELVDALLHRLVEGRGRLVEKDPVGLVEQHARDREALLLVRRELLVPRRVSSRRVVEVPSPSSPSTSRIRSSEKVSSGAG